MGLSEHQALYKVMHSQPGPSPFSSVPKFCPPGHAPSHIEDFGAGSDSCSLKLSHPPQSHLPPGQLVHHSGCRVSGPPHSQRPPPLSHSLPCSNPCTGQPGPLQKSLLDDQLIAASFKFLGFSQQSSPAPGNRSAPSDTWTYTGCEHRSRAGVMDAP